MELEENKDVSDEIPSAPGEYDETAPLRNNTIIRKRKESKTIQSTEEAATGTVIELVGRRRICLSLYLSANIGKLLRSRT